MGKLQITSLDSQEIIDVNNRKGWNMVSTIAHQNGRFVPCSLEMSFSATSASLTSGTGEAVATANRRARAAVVKRMLSDVVEVASSKRMTAVG